jgi:capsule polysaccharide export protein KpsE/RkpR
LFDVPLRSDLESLRRNSVIPEVDTSRDIAFSPLRESPTLVADPPATRGLANLELIWEKRGLLYRVALRALVVSTIIAFLIPKRFESTVSIMPPRDSMSDSGLMLAAMAGKASSGLGAMAGNILGAKSTGALFVDLMRSRTVQDQIVDKYDLQHVYWTRYKQDARKLLNARTEVTEDRKSGVISLTVTDNNPERARDVAQGYVEALDRLVSQVSTSSARRERMFIEQRLAAVKADLEDAEKEFSTFASKNTALDIKEQTRAMVESAAVLQGQMIAAESELQSLQQIYTENNVRVRALRARANELKRQLQQMGGTDSSLVDEGTSSNELYPSIRKLPLLGVQWADLYRRMKVQETVYDLLTQQYELARIQEAKEIPTVNVIDPANVPEKKSYPPRLLVIVSLTTVSLVIAALCVIGSSRWQEIDPDEPKKRFANRVWRRTLDWGQNASERLHLDRVTGFLRRRRGRSVE